MWRTISLITAVIAAKFGPEKFHMVTRETSLFQSCYLGALFALIVGGAMYGIGRLLKLDED